jgi:hypothetical protein
MYPCLKHRFQSRTTTLTASDEQRIAAFSHNSQAVKKPRNRVFDHPITDLSVFQDAFHHFACKLGTKNPVSEGLSKLEY